MPYGVTVGTLAIIFIIIEIIYIAQHHDAPLLHPPRPLHRRNNWNCDTTLRRAQHQQPVQYLRLQQRCERAQHGYIGVSAAEEYL
jgi:hypothetical protein